MKGADLWFTIGVGLTLLGAGYILGASLINARRKLEETADARGTGRAPARHG